MTLKSKLFAIAIGVLSLALVAWFMVRGLGGPDLRAGIEQQILQRVAEHRRLEAEVSPVSAGEGAMAVYLAHIRRDGVPSHAALHRQLAAIGQVNAELLALAEAYEPAARQPDYASRLRELRTYVITWNDRWNGIFETFMAGGNLAGSEPQFPARFAEVFAKK